MATMPKVTIEYWGDVNYDFLPPARRQEVAQSILAALHVRHDAIAPAGIHMSIRAVSIEWTDLDERGAAPERPAPRVSRTPD